MRVLLVVAWLFVGLFAVIYHFGPGQRHMVLDDVGQHLKVARQHVKSEEWSLAVNHFDSALEGIPSDLEQQSREIRLEKAKAQMMASGLPEARAELESLLEESIDEDCEQRFIAEVRSSLASAQYYMTWLMRLEGLNEEAWLPEIEAARQNYKLIAEHSEEIDDDELLKRSKEDLESAIRLARMDLSELQGLPLPSQ